jgi:hypothetical protein
VLKVLFEFKGELDHEIKIFSKMTNLRSNVNNNLMNTNRVRRRFIRHKNDFIFSEAEQGDGASREAHGNGTGIGSGVGIDHGNRMAKRTTGINNYIIGDKAVTRVRDKQYYDDDEESSDEEFDTKIAYPVMREGIDGQQNMILHSNIKLRNRSVAASLNNSFSMARGGPNAKGIGNASAYSGSTMWDVKQQRLGGRSRVKRVENGIFKPRRH